MAPIIEADLIESVDDTLQAMADAEATPHLAIVVDVARFVREVTVSEAKRLVAETADPAVKAWADEIAERFSAPWAPATVKA